MKALRRLLLFLPVLLLLLAGVVSAQDVTVTFWSHAYPPREALDRELIALFEAENPGIKVEYVIPPSANDTEYIIALFTAIAGGEGPDLFNVVIQGVPDLIPSGAVAPVDAALLGYASTDEIVAEYLEGSIAAFVGDDGLLYGFPTEIGNYALYINTTLFEEAGLDPVADAPATWEDMLAIAPALTKRDDAGNLTQRAFDFAYPVPEEQLDPLVVTATLAYQLGSGIVNEDKTEASFGDDGWVQAVSFIKEWSETYGDPNIQPAWMGFYEGKVAMHLSGPWYQAQVLTAQNPDLIDDLVIVPTPRFADGVNAAGSYTYGYGLFVNAASTPEEQAAAQQLAQFMSSSPERYLAEALLLQPRLTLVENTEVMDSSFASLFIADMAGAPSLPVITNGFEASGIFGRALAAILFEGADVAEALAGADEEFTAVINP
jgi:multiple sugar transport system substrate-binding protein